MAMSLIFGNLRGAGLVGAPEATEAALSAVPRPPECRTVLDPLVLVSQSVPDASLVPCLESLPLGWDFRAVDVTSESSRFFIDYDRTGLGEMTATYQPGCDVTGATRGVSDKASSRMYQRVNTLAPRYLGTRIYVFDGGCLQFDYDFRGEGRTALADEITDAFGFVQRSTIEDELRGLGLNP
jgi:hypothetical protein